MNRIFQLLGELHHDLDDWIDCCRRILLFSVKHNDLRFIYGSSLYTWMICIRFILVSHERNSLSSSFGSSTVDLLKQLSYRCCNDEVMMGVAFDEVCSSLPIIFVMYDFPFKALFDIFVR